MIYPVLNYHAVLQYIKESCGIGITATIETSMSSLSEMADVSESVNDICILLSLIRGCRVTTISSEVIDEDDHTICFTGCSMPPKRYSTDFLWISDSRYVSPYHGESTKRFIESAYPQLPNAKTLWAIDKIIEYYLDAKRDGDEFGFWGLKMANCMEFLCSQYIKQSSGNSILKSGCFNRFKNNILPKLKETLKETVKGIQQDQIDAICSKLPELNRYPYKSTLLDMNQHTGARISDQAVEKFVRMRNALVHSGEYDREYGDPGDQYRSLGDYIYRFLLSILGQPMDSVWAGYNWGSDGSAIVDSNRHDLIN